MDAVESALKAFSDAMVELSAAIEKSCSKTAYLLRRISFILNRRYPIGKVALRRNKAIKRSRRNNETVKRYKHGRTQRTRVKR